MDHKKVNEWNAMKLGEYNGTYEIISGNEAEGGTFYPTWAIVSEYSEEVGSGIPKKKADGKFMVLPVKVVLGNYEEAKANLKWLLEQLLTPTATPVDVGTKGPDDEDVPF